MVIWGCLYYKMVVVAAEQKRRQHVLESSCGLFEFIGFVLKTVALCGER